MSTSSRGQWSRAPLAAVSFAAARVHARPTRGLVTGLGIAVAVAALFVTTASPVIAGDATLRRTLAELSPGARSITVAVSVNTKTPEELHQIDQQVRDGLHGPGVGKPQAEVEYRALAAADGTIFRLAGVDQLADVVTVTEGRLPQSCTPTRCEVLVIGTKSSVTPPPDLDLDIVGRAVLDDPAILSGSFSPGANEVIVLGDGGDAVGAVQPLELIGRSLGWVAPIDPATVRITDISSILAAAARTANSFAEGGGTVDVPREALVDARARADTASNRVALAAAQGVILVVAFALLAAAGARRQHGAARELLRRRGANRSTVNVFTVCEALWPVLIGLVIGVPAGLGLTAMLAHSWHFDAGDLVVEIARDAVGRVLLGAMVVLVATAAIMASAPAPGARVARPWWRPRPIDALGLGALGTAALALNRGSATPSSLVAKGDPLLAVLPLLAGLVAAWVAIRFVPPVVVGLARMLGRRAPLARTALGEVARRPTVPLLTAGFLAATTTLGLFSLGYRSTLANGDHDQAAFAVPLDVTLTEGAALVRPSALQPSGGWASIAAGTTATEVLSRGVTVHSRQLTNDTVTVLGLEPSALHDLRVWRRDYGPPPSELAAKITPAAPPPDLGTPLPESVRKVVLHGSGDLRITDITLVLQRRDGTWHEANAIYDAQAPDQLEARVDPDDGGGRLIGFRMGQPGTDSAKIEHHLGEGNSSAAFFTATVSFDKVDAIGAGGATTDIGIDWAGLKSDGATVTHQPGGLKVDLKLQGSTALVLPSSAVALNGMEAIVDPTTAAAAENGNVVIDVPGPMRMTMRVAAVATQFPGAPDRFIIVDRGQLKRAFDLLNPGFGTATEVWLAVPKDHEAQLSSALRQAPYDQLVMSRRSSIEATLHTNPLSRFTLGLFAVAGLVAALLAIAATHLATQSDAAEQAPLHRALAAEGVPPRSLSRMVRIASSAIAVAAILIGVIGALVLLRTVTGVIAVTATSTVPEPPLLPSVPALQVLIAIVGIAVPCLLAAALAARAARRAAHGDLLREFG